MQHKPLPTLKRHTAVMLCAVLSCAGARAAELGEMTVHSFIGQPLVVDIELTALAPDEANGLQARLAAADVYRVANIGIDAALQSLSITVLRRESRQILHITTLRPVDAAYLHLFLQLSGGGRSAVRAATVWLTADPAPPLRPAIAVPPGVPAAMPAPPLKPPRAAMIVAPLAPPKPSAPARAIAHAPAPRAPDAQCIALDRKNAALTAKLAELEGKITLLQGNVGPAPLAPGPVAKPLTKPGPRPLAGHTPSAVKPKPLTAPPPPIKTGAAQFWLIPLLVGAGVLLAAGWWWWRKKYAGPALPAKYWLALRKPFARKRLTAPVAAIEPVPE
ncbi:hypothetical protein AAKU55_001076 [Oxalobacteraceae bacterium GrIS 1.11]